MHYQLRAKKVSLRPTSLGKRKQKCDSPGKTYMFQFFVNVFWDDADVIRWLLSGVLAFVVLLDIFVTYACLQQ